MNSNLFHNLANIASIVLAAATAVLLATGCTADLGGTIECSASFIDPKWTAMGVVGLNVLKMVVNVVRDGFAGLTKPQPPVES